MEATLANGPGTHSSALASLPQTRQQCALCQPGCWRGPLTVPILLTRDCSTCNPRLPRPRPKLARAAPPIDVSGLLGVALQTNPAFSQVTASHAVSRPCTPQLPASSIWAGQSGSLCCWERVENMSWELPALTILALIATGFWWTGSPHHPSYRRVFYAVLCPPIALLLNPHQLVLRIYADVHAAILDFSIDALLTHHLKMVLTLGAVVWLALPTPRSGI